VTEPSRHGPASASDDRDTFTALWVRAQPIVSGFVTATVRQRHDVEDIVQEIALTAAKDHHKYDPARPFLPWVLTIARHKVIDYQRRRDADPLTFSGETLETLSEAASDLTPELGDRQLLLEDCLDRVPPKSRRILEMRYYPDMSAGAISSQLGVGTAAVFSTLHRLRALLLKCIEENMEGKRQGKGRSS
jgi:RNA polymerase sigma-70 factor (ECF subfamily)